MSRHNLTFEERARQASAGVKEAVDGAELQLFEAGIPALRTAVPGSGRRGLHWSDRWVAAAGAFAAILIVIGLALLPGRLFAPDNDEVAGTTQPTPDSIVAPDEGGPSETEGTAAPEPETTTSTAPEVGSTTLAADTIPPELTVTAPDDGATVSGEKSETGRGLLQFAGLTEPGAQVIAAGQWEADVDAEGHWEIILGLNSGPNIVSFTAIDAAGNETTVEVTVTYEPPAPTTTTSTTHPEEDPGGEGGETGGEHDFSANAQFGSCEENPPYDVYWGTADPGSKITVTSDFGSGTVYADQTGNWEIRVEFPEAPYNAAYLVTVTEVDTGASKKFEFISYASA